MRLCSAGSRASAKTRCLSRSSTPSDPGIFRRCRPQQVLGRFNGFLKAVILRISEARDLGEFDRFKFYDHMKSYTASPPDTLRIDEKNLREYAILNCLRRHNHDQSQDGRHLPSR